MFTDINRFTAEKRNRRGVYLIPSLFTVGNLVFGFFSLLFSFKGEYSKAAWAILAATAFDIADGWIARFTKSSSHFGMEFDSLADFISFGVAPAFLIYQTLLVNYGKLGIIIALLFVIAGAIRLARYNTKVEKMGIAYFQGLPIPVAGCILASLVIAYYMLIQDNTKGTIPFVMKEVPHLWKMIPLVMVILSYLMVSNIPYNSFKGYKLAKSKPLRYLILAILVGIIIWLYPENMILIILVAYTLSGIIDTMLRFYRMRRAVKRMKGQMKPGLTE